MPLDVIRRLLTPFTSPVDTSRYPAVGPLLQPATRGLPELVSESCTADGSCVAACPTGAIELIVPKPGPKSKATAVAASTWRLDAGKCIFCSACTVACPNAAIEPGSQVALANRDRAALTASSAVGSAVGGSASAASPPAGRASSAATSATATSATATSATATSAPAAATPAIARSGAASSAAATPAIARSGAASSAAPTSAAERLDAAAADRFGRSLHVRHLDAGSCNGCDFEIAALLNPYHDVQRLGIDFVASPRHADLLLVTGVMTRNLQEAARRTYDAMPEPRLVVAVGACAISGGVFAGSPMTGNGVGGTLPVDVFVPGCPPRPEAIIEGMLMALSGSRGAAQQGEI